VTIPRIGPDRRRALAIVAALAASAAGCARLPVAPAVTTVPKHVTSGGIGTAEARDPRLRDSLARLRREPSGAAHREVAAAYRALEITDRAFDHLRSAVALDQRDAAAHDQLARMWRDWGLPQLGMADARAAVKHAPRSPVAHNTLGTLLEAMGRFGQARQAYQRALALDPDAAYAVANLKRLHPSGHPQPDARRNPVPSMVTP
jgi:tetratricopeptide (TPR) repeat protein